MPLLQADATDDAHAVECCISTGSGFLFLLVDAVIDGSLDKVVTTGCPWHVQSQPHHTQLLTDRYDKYL